MKLVVSFWGNEAIAMSQKHASARAKMSRISSTAPAPQRENSPTKVRLNDSDVGGRTRTNKAQRLFDGSWA